MGQRLQSAWESIRNYIERTLEDGPLLRWPSLIVGALAGLMLGLLIGYVIAPVQWSNAYPSDLADEAKAQYLSAVADAYVARANPAAAEIAQQRLFGLNENLAQEIEAAQLFFVEQGMPDSAIRANNLAQLGAALGVDTQASTQASADVAADSAANDAVNSADSGRADGGGLGDWVLFFLVLLAALLIAAGVLLWLRNRRDHAAEEDVDDNKTDIGENKWQIVEGSSIPVDSGSGRDSDDNLDDDSDNDSDNDSDVDPDDPWQDWEEDDVRREEAEPFFNDGHGDYASGERNVTIIDVSADDSNGRRGFVDDDDDHAPFRPRPQRAPAPTTSVTGRRQASERDLFEGEPARQPPSARTVPPPWESQSSGGGTVRAVADEKDKSKERSRPHVLGTFEFTYSAGDPADAESENIHSTDGERYVGECGIAVNSKNRILTTDPEKVMALDVWLFDKVDEDEPLHKAQLLLSPLGALEDLFGTPRAGRGDGSQPMLAESDSHFRLHGSNLVLDGYIINADFIEQGELKGAFQSVTIEATILQRAGA